MEISGSLLDIEEFDKDYCLMLFDVDNIIGEDEIVELKISKRIINLTFELTNDD